MRVGFPPRPTTPRCLERLGWIVATSNMRVRIPPGAPIPKIGIDLAGRLCRSLVPARGSSFDSALMALFRRQLRGTGGPAQASLAGLLVVDSSSSQIHNSFAQLIHVRWSFHPHAPVPPQDVPCRTATNCPHVNHSRQTTFTSTFGHYDRENSLSSLQSQDRAYHRRLRRISSGAISSTVVRHISSKARIVRFATAPASDWVHLWLVCPR